jgi:4-amino-4-deoxy-L-arabinose transferase-like glycosyltransferase
MMQQADPSRKAVAALAFAVAAALCAAPLAGHADDSDAQLYTVLARHMARDGALFDPHYLPGLYPHFREHLPFGLWPWALVERAAGERALPLLALLCTLGTLAIVLRVGTRLFGLLGGAAAVLLLGATESYFHYGAIVHLDRLLLLFATASIALLVEPQPRWVLATLFAALAALVKGPFGLVPLVAASIARAVALRRPRDLFAGALCTLAAAAPVAGFLALDALAGAGTWWEGYGKYQLLRSAQGTRLDGEHHFFLPFTSVLGRFWPALPLALLGLWRGAADLRARKATPLALLSVLCLALLGLLCLPARKVWHHSLVAYPPLALLSAGAAAPWLERLWASPRRARIAVGALAALTGAIALAAALGAGARVVGRQCLIAPQLVAALPPRSDVIVVPPDWKVVALLAQEHDLLPWPALAVPADGALVTWGETERKGTAAVALVRIDALPAPLPPGWREQAREQGWALLRR